MGVLFLKILQFAEDLVVFGVGDFRFGLGVIELVVVVDEPPELRDALFGRGKVGEEIQFLLGHGKGINE